MAKVIDVNNFGKVEKTQIRFERVSKITATDGQRGMKEIVERVTEIQPILEAGEVKELGDAAEWKESPESFKVYGKYMAIVSGRRFFTDVEPVKEKKPTSGSKGTAKKDE